MLVRAARWFLITAPVVAGILVLILGTAGGISVAFGVVLIGIGPIVWMWNFFVRMSFEEPERAKDPREPEASRDPDADHDPRHKPVLNQHRSKVARRPRRRL